MAKQTWLWVLTVFLVVCALAGLLVLIGFADSLRRVILDSRGELARPPLVEREERVAPDELGSADFLPDDVSVYLAVFDLRPRAERVWDSNAVRHLRRQPQIQQGLDELRNAPFWGEVREELEADPELQNLFDVLADAASHELFVAAGADFTDVVRALQRISLVSNIAGIASALDAATEPLMVNTVLEHREDLRVPSVLAGFKLADVPKARQAIDHWVPKIEEAPVGRLETREIGDDTFYVFELTGDDIPDDVKREMATDFLESGIPFAQGRALLEWLGGLRLVLAVGIRDGYLLLSVGSDIGLVERWGEAPSLAASATFEPLRTHAHSAPGDISYQSEDVTRAGTISPALLRDAFEKAAPLIAQADETLEERIIADIDNVAALLDDAMRPPMGQLAFSFERAGIESYKFEWPAEGSVLDPREPLSIIEHRTADPLIYTAARLKPISGVYDLLATVAQLGEGYLEDFLKPELSPEEAGFYAAAMEIVRPLFPELDAAIREDLIPAADATELMAVLDGRGRLPGIPDLPPGVDRFDLPRLALALRLHDVEQFKRGISRCADAINEAIDKARRDLQAPFPEEFAIPRPVQRQVHGHTMYYWPISGIELSADLTLCALFVDDVLVLSTSTLLAAETVPRQDPPPPVQVELDRPAGSVARADLLGLWNYLGAQADTLLELGKAQADRPDVEREEITVVHDVFTAVLHSLGAVREFRSRTYRDGGRMVTHHWLHVEDIEGIE